MRVEKTRSVAITCEKYDIARQKTLIDGSLRLLDALPERVALRFDFRPYRLQDKNASGAADSATEVVTNMIHLNKSK